MIRRGGIDLGGTKILAVVVDERHRVLTSSRRDTPATGGPAAVVHAMAEAMRDATKAARVETKALASVGVGSPGTIDTAAGTVSHAGNLPGWTRPFPLAAVLEAELGAPVALANDVGAAVEAEAALGAGQGHRSMLGVWWGTGIGGGVVLDGMRWTGRGAAGEIGHTVISERGARCPCGRVGCLEAYAGRRAMEVRARRAKANGDKTRLFHWMKEKGLARLSSSVWAKGLAKKDPLAVKLLARAERGLAVGIASAVNLLDVECVVIGGGMGSRFGTALARRLAKAMKPHLFVPERPPAVLTAALGDLAGAVGASLVGERAFPKTGPKRRRPRRPPTSARTASGPRAPKQAAIATPSPAGPRT